MSYVQLKKGKIHKNIASIRFTMETIGDIHYNVPFSEYGYVGYNSLCNGTSKKAVDAMIENNVVHLRPCTIFPFDIEGISSEYPIVTPHLPCNISIMKELFHQHNNNC